jgi:branched-chain amino acid aminotransferase
MKHNIKITKAEHSRIKEVDKNDLHFGKHYSDHMFIAECDHGKWKNARIEPFHNLSLHPATSCLHYGQLIFEGMKAFKDAKGNALLFRPDMNLERINISARRMAMPEVPEQLFMDALTELVKIDKQWIPTGPGFSLYLRPFMMAVDEFIGIRPTEKFQLVIICSPAPPYYSHPVKVMTTDKYVRAFPGGAGYAKAAGNYGASMIALREAIANGYDQVLWLDAVDHRYAEEIGTMNVFFVIDDVFITPSLENETILDGVTRECVIFLARQMGATVEERKVDMEEIVEANKSGRLQDAFGTGTAASIAPISQIQYGGQDHVLPPVEDRVWYKKIKTTLEDIKTGKIDDEFGWVVHLDKKAVVV